jgi:hypothetical protein
MNIQPIPTLESSIRSSPNATLRRITDPDQSLFLLKRIRNTSDQRPTSQSNHPEINISMNIQPIPTLESSICTSPNAPLRRITDPDQSLFLLKESATPVIDARSRNPITPRSIFQ